MTFVITVCNLKGGTAKTTTSMMTAAALVAQGYSVRVVDMDLMQGSASAWLDDAEKAGFDLGYSVNPHNVHSLRRMPMDTDFVIIDCPPNTPDLIDAAINRADLVLIPVMPSGLEMTRMWATLALAGGKGEVLLVRVVPNTVLARNVEQVLEDNHVPMFPVKIHQRQGVCRAFGTSPEQLFGYEDVASHVVQRAGVGTAKAVA